MRPRSVTYEDTEITTSLLRDIMRVCLPHCRLTGLDITHNPRLLRISTPGQVFSSIPFLIDYPSFTELSGFSPYQSIEQLVGYPAMPRGGLFVLP